VDLPLVNPDIRIVYTIPPRSEEPHLNLDFGDDDAEERDSAKPEDADDRDERLEEQREDRDERAEEAREDRDERAEEGATP
jgi:hypothetical protein